MTLYVQGILNEKILQPNLQPAHLLANKTYQEVCCLIRRVH